MSEIAAAQHAGHSDELAHHFESLEQQHEAGTIGMWAFLVTEVMFFGGFFLGYTVYRVRYPEAFAEGSRLLGAGLGAFNTAVLLLSSLTMALAVRGAQTGDKRSAVRQLVFTMVLASAFLGIKTYEYAGKFSHGLVPGAHFHFDGPAELAGQVELFIGLYFAMTGVHAAHMVIGIVLMAIVAWRAHRGRYTRGNYMGVECLGLYWHFVDLVWIFLFPMLYLLGRHQ